MKRRFAAYMAGFILLGASMGMNGCGADALLPDSGNASAPEAGPEENPGAPEEAADPAGEDSGVGAEISGSAAGEETASRFLPAFRCLDEESCTAYQEILKALEEHLEEVRLSTKDEEVIGRAYQAVMSDHGGIFWVNGYTYTLHTLGSQVRGIDFMPSYTVSREERESLQAQVEEAAADYLAQIPLEASDYEKVKRVYELLIERVRYDLDSEENQNILSVFLHGESVCSGFASATQYLLSLLDVPCMTVYGTSRGEPHAWNLVDIDGEPYYVDVTWGSALSGTVGDCSYAYLNLNDRDVEATHQAEMLFELPECTSVEAGYYAMEGRYFTVLDERRLGEILAASRQAGERSAAVKFSSDEEYRQAFELFIGDGKVADYCPGLESVGYVESRELKVLTFQW